MGGVILLQEIIASNWIYFLIPVELRKTKIVVFAKLEDMDKANQAISSGTRFLTNMACLSMSKKERPIAHILATKFHNDPAIELESGVRLNHVMRDLIINGHARELYK
jgi:hypothetical protein